MAKSNAKKQRENLVREGRNNPEDFRGVYALTDMRTRKTKTKKDIMNKMKYNKRFSYDQDGDNRFFIAL
ncbi:hypothetical protein [Falsibacillus pallidus]|uniref:Uncharacterized protein n=1 Tax=Falsibacillus pallidus TaxID=493781 RepID=A0A370GVI0_9BACI|nr:hypothetical protein [Falsibacillus pallidus]RDI45923.1 hypothetical protein DFR59_102559 [Falsibacillus pallidus]